MQQSAHIFSGFGFQLAGYITTLPLALLLVLLSLRPVLFDLGVLVRRLY